MGEAGEPNVVEIGNNNGSISSSLSLSYNDRYENVFGILLCPDSDQIVVDTEVTVVVYCILLDRRD